MAFFDRLSKTVAEAGQKTIAKTKELADTSRLNMMISDEEKMINNQYLQIGKLYVSTHKDDFEEDFAEMISAIAGSEAKIRDYRKQIQDIKGVQRCEKCGAEVPNGAAFCSACGAVMPKAPEPAPSETQKCEHCGAEVKEGMRFCTSCGKPLETPDAGDDAAEPAVQAAEEQLCSDCGTQTEEHVDACTKCDTEL